jgi:hypothetical protein
MSRKRKRENYCMLRSEGKIIACSNKKKAHVGNRTRTHAGIHEGLDPLFTRGKARAIKRILHSILMHNLYTCKIIACSNKKKAHVGNRTRNHAGIHMRLDPLFTRGKARAIKRILHPILMHNLYTCTTAIRTAFVDNSVLSVNFSMSSAH